MMLTTILQLFLALSTLFSPFSRENETVVAFVDVTVIPMTGPETLQNQTVLVIDDRIVAVGPVGQIDVPEGARRIDGRGRYLIPGLAEMHGHIPPPSQPAAEIENTLFLYVANGITTVRGMLGYENQLLLRERANREEIVSPTLYLAGPSFNGNSIRSPEEAVRKARLQKAEGWDLIKIHPGLTREEYDAMAETAHDLGMRFGGHVPADVGLSHALDMGQETFDHLDGYVEFAADESGRLDETRLSEIVRKTKDKQAWVVPTMALWETLLGVNDLSDMKSFDELRYVPVSTRLSWERAVEGRLSNPSYDAVVASTIADSRMRVLEVLHKAGVGVLMGTDSPQLFSVPGFSLHRELGRMVEAGMTPYDVLVSGTANVGRYFESRDSFGTVEPGNRADLLLLEKNPLDDVSNLSERAGVMVRGRWFPAEELQERLNAIAEGYAN